MTINVAWRSANDVFLVTDSALTYPFGGRPQESLSAVGEVHRAGPHRVEESGAKLAVLSGAAIAAYAGDTHAAQAALKILSDNLAANVDFHDSLLLVARTFESAPRFQLVVAGSVAGRSELWIVDPGNPATILREIYADRDPVILGSLPGTGSDHIRETVLELYKLEPLAGDPGRFLASTIMALQAMGQRVNLFQDSAGGTFFGMMLRDGRAVFQDDLFYFLFRGHHLQPSPKDAPIYLFAGIREGVLITCSSLTQGYRLFLSGVQNPTGPDIDAFMTALIAECGGRIPTSVPHYGFVDRETGALVQVYCPSRRPHVFFTFRDNCPVIEETLGRALSSLPASQDGILPASVPHLFFEECPPAASTQERA